MENDLELSKKLSSNTLNAGVKKKNYGALSQF